MGSWRAQSASLFGRVSFALAPARALAMRFATRSRWSSSWVSQIAATVGKAAEVIPTNGIHLCNRHVLLGCTCIKRCFRVSCLYSRDGVAPG